MRADNAPDYTTWDREQLSPALAQIPLNKLGAGLGCWIDSRTKGTWNVKNQSAIDRVCLLMNKSVRASSFDTTAMQPRLDAWLSVVLTRAPTLNPSRFRYLRSICLS